MTSAASRTTARIGWELHGARVDLQVASDEALAYLRAHFGPEAVAPPASPDLRILIDWRWGTSDASAAASAGATEGAERVGRSLFEREGRLLWTHVPGFEGLTLEAGRAGSTTVVRASCGYIPRDTLARLRYMNPARRAKKTNRTLFKLLYYAFYFPLAWHLERTRGWELIHASAVERGGDALILAGHGGAGKSTLSLSLLADPAVRFISDNLVLHDGRSVHALPEPIRLDAASLRAIRAAGYDPAPTDLPRTAHPKPTFRVAPGRTAASAALRTIVLLRFADRPFLRPLSPAGVVAHLRAATDLAREIEAYRAVASFLSMAVAGEGSGAEGATETPAGLRALASGARGFVMGIGTGEPVADTLERLREILP